MITVTATRHRHRDSSPRAIDPAAVVETTLLALDKMNECVDAFARRVRDAFETHLAGALPLDALGASGVRGVHDDARGGDGQHGARWSVSVCHRARGEARGGGAGAGRGGWWMGRDSCTRALVGASRVALMWCDMGLGVCSSVYVSCVLIEL